MLLSVAIVTGVGECVVAELQNTSAGAPERVCTLVPGQIAWDDCQCGQLAQTIVSVTPTNAFPAPATDFPVTACGPNMLAVSVTLSLTRCVPGIDNSGRSPSCNSLLAAAITLEEDRAAIRRGVNCCLWDMRERFVIHQYTVGVSNTLGPEGQCAGSDLTYQFAINTDCCR